MSRRHVSSADRRQRPRGRVSGPFGVLGSGVAADDLRYDSGSRWAVGDDGGMDMGVAWRWFDVAWRWFGDGVDVAMGDGRHPAFANTRATRSAAAAVQLSANQRARCSRRGISITFGPNLEAWTF